MAAGANLVGQAGHPWLLSRVGGENQPSLAVEHPDAIDPLFVSDHAHDLVRGLPIVVEHGVPRGARDTSRKLIRPKDHGPL